ncbi:MAG TPA: nuclear transport factor 2 family protein [Steroidobacteraceae bacterium]|nr:nuclear transport factor 2 family protein [Steroidobacteraceae bacterium]HRX88980.1 nuclear transport factor 2 family protein [Steroidobacteraceae bacterium]
MADAIDDETERSLAERIRQLEDREQIRELVATYCLVVDSRDTDSLAECFCEDGSMASRDGAMNAVGRDAVMAQFHQRFAVLGPSFHYTHDHAIWFDGENSNRAFGLANSHAEVVRSGKPMIAAIRYEDEYRREGGRWRFYLRLLSFFYYLSPVDYPAALPTPLRNRAYNAPIRADFPEASPTYSAYYQKYIRR